MATATATVSVDAVTKTLVMPKKKEVSFWSRGKDLQALLDFFHDEKPGFNIF